MNLPRLFSSFLRGSSLFHSGNSFTFLKDNKWGPVFASCRGLARRVTSVYEVGDSGTLSRTFSAQDLRTLADLTHDFNPIHIDPEFAKTTRYRKCIVHGVLLNGMISAIFATQIPGPGAIYLSSTLFFPNPLFVDEPVTADISIKELLGTVMTCSVLATATDRDSIVLRGEARVLIPKSKMKIVDDKDEWI